MHSKVNVFSWYSLWVFAYYAYYVAANNAQVNDEGPM